MKHLLFLLPFFFLLNSNLTAQTTTDCSNANLFCTGVTYEVPLDMNILAESGPNYACMYTQYNPVWYYLLIDQPGNINIFIESPTGNDIDFVAWGPFSSLNNVCSTSLTADCTDCPSNNTDPSFYPSGNTVDCSYSTSPSETCHFSNTLTGQYYILCITNFSNNLGDVSFSQINAGMPGAGTTNCSYSPDNCIFADMGSEVTPCDSITNTFTLTGTITFSEIRDSGFVTITPPIGLPVNIYPPFDTTETFTFSGLIADQQYQTVDFMYNNDPECQAHFSFLAPAPCINCYADAGVDTSACGLEYDLHAAGITGYTGFWSCDSSGVVFQTPDSNYSHVQVPTQGYYHFTWTNISPTNDTCSDDVTIRFKNIPTSDFSVSTTTPLCEHDSLHIIYTGTGSLLTQFNWTITPAYNPVNGTPDEDFWLSFPSNGTKYIRLIVEDDGCVSPMHTIPVSIPSGFTLITSVDTSSCLSGYPAVQVYATGTYPPYLYNWSNTVGPPFSAGTYTVTATDTRGCAEIKSFTVDTLSYTLTTNYQNLTCYNNNSGKIFTAVSGGTPPYVYHWSNNSVQDTLTGLAAGTYSVTVTDQTGCILTHSVTLNQPSNIVVNKTITNVVCFNDCNGKITTTISGGTAPFSYHWSTNDNVSFIDSLCPGAYNLTVTDSHGCISYQSNITVANHADMIINMANALPDCNSTCNGIASVTSVTNAYTPFTYNWSNGGSGATQDSLCADSYTVTIVDFKGCTKSATKVIPSSTGTVLQHVIINDSISCVTGCSGATVTSASGGTTPYTYHLGTFQNTTGNFNNICPGNYSAWTTDVNNCFSPSTPVTIQGLPAVEANAGPDQQVCNGSYITLTATGGVSYVWTTPAQQGVPFIYNSNKTYYVTVTDANGCTGIDYLYVTIRPLPTANAGVDRTVCLGNSVTLTATGGTSYEWNNSVVQGQPFYPTTTGTYTVTVTNIYGCTKTDQVVVTVIPSPVANAGPDITICEGNSLTLMATGGTSYAWSNLVVQGQPFTPVAGGVYTVTVTGSNGCTDTDELFLTLNPLPNANAGSDLQICLGDSVTLIATGGTTYLWSPSYILQEVSFVPTADVTCYVTVTGANGCTKTDTVFIDVQPLPVADAGSDISICEGSSVTLTATGGESYVWDNMVVQDIPFIPAQSITYNVTVTNNYGCSSTDQMNLTLYPLPVADAGLDTAICTGESLVLNATGGTIYTWSNGLVQDSVFSPLSTQIYYVTVTDINGCSAIDSIEITINQLPQLLAGNDISICMGDYVVFSALSDYPVTWNNGVIQDVPFIPVSSLTYICTAVDSNECVSIDSVYIEITDPTIYLLESQDTLFANGPFQQNGCVLQWFDSDSLIEGETSVYFIPDYSSNFHVVSTCGSCQDTSNIIIYTYTGISKLKIDEVLFYPNPAHNEITVENINQYTALTLTDETGRILQTLHIENKNKLTVSLKNYSPGVYFIKLSGKDKNTFNRTILKQ